jgi:hypothetical protein
MANIHIISPFSRPHIFSQLQDVLRPFNLTWHLITHLDWRPTSLENAEPWVKWHAYTPPADSFDVCYDKCNWALRNIAWPTDCWVSMLGDDDGLPPDFYEKLGLDHVDADTDVVVSSVHYYFAPHGHVQLPACKENCRVSKIGLECLFFRGRILPELTYSMKSHAADGLMAEHVVKKYKCEFRPDAWAEYNRFHPNFDWLNRRGL